MGYSTQFMGVLKFKEEAKASEFAKLKTILGEDCRSHLEWDAPGLYYIDLEITPDFSGLQWSGAEKTYDMPDLVNVVIKEMQKEFPLFGLEGTMAAQGESVEDRWLLVIGEDGFAKRVENPPAGQKIACPRCEEVFYYELDREAP